MAALSLPGEDHAGGTLPPLAGLSASFGVSACEAGRPPALEALLAQADAALYAAKAAGRNRVESAAAPRGDACTDVVPRTASVSKQIPVTT